MRVLTADAGVDAFPLSVWVLFVLAPTSAASLPEAQFRQRTYYFKCFCISLLYPYRHPLL